LGRSIDRASRSRHSKFKPVVLGEIQAAGDTQGKIRVIVGHPGTEASGNELDQWIAKREKDAHQA
jgi:hypothetical protein